jgi:hypothetical protein
MQAISLDRSADARHDQNMKILLIEDNESPQLTGG